MSLNFDLHHKHLRSSKELSFKFEDGLEPVLTTFEMLGIGCLIVSRTGQMISRNAAFDRLKLDLYPGWLRSRSKATDQIVTDAFQRAKSVAQRVSRKLPELGTRIVIHRLNGGDMGDAFLVTFHPVGMRPSDKADVPKRFSPVETGILECISHGHNLRETSALVHIPYNTVRKYVQNLLIKTSCRTQAHLVAHYVSAKSGHPTKDMDFTFDA